MTWSSGVASASALGVPEFLLLGMMTVAAFGVGSSLLVLVLLRLAGCPPGSILATSLLGVILESIGLDLDPGMCLGTALEYTLI